MLVQGFGTPEERRVDFEVFRLAMKATEIAPMLYQAPAFGGQAFYLGWCDCEPHFQTIDVRVAAV